MSVQFIEKDGRQEFAVLPADDYRALLEKAEMLDDLAAYDRARAELANGEDELVPAWLVDAILDGESPIKAWRKHRGLSQIALAGQANISQAYLAQLEAGKKEGSLGVYRALAEALNVDLDDLVG